MHIRNIFEIRSDLALEINEQVNKKNGILKGIIINETKDNESDIKVTVLEITNEKGEKALKRPKGKYITIEAKKMSLSDDEYNQRAAMILAENLKELLSEYCCHKSNMTVLVVGLGNADMTADALGPSVVKNIEINRHFSKEEGIKTATAGLTPGVMAQTGMETADVVKGIVNTIKPDILIAIDSLAARECSRLNTTIQLSDKGIHPGSGVGNHRTGITKETIGIPVVAIGVPTVIAAPTIVNDTIENFLKAIAQQQELKSICNIFSEYSPKEKYELICEVISPEMADMYVTPKDVDANIKIISSILTKAINKACEEL